MRGISSLKNKTIDQYNIENKNSFFMLNTQKLPDVLMPELNFTNASKTNYVREGINFLSYHESMTGYF